MKGSSGRKLRRLLTQPWRQRKQDRDGVRRKAAFDIELRERVVRALKAQAEERERQEEQSA